MTDTPPDNAPLPAPPSDATSSPRPPSFARRSGFVLRWLLFRFALVVGGFCLLLATFQRSLIYHPEPADALPAAAAGFPIGSLHDVTMPTTAGDLHGWHALPAGQRAASAEEAAALLRNDDAPVVLYFPGNAGHRGFRLDEFDLLTALGAHVVLFDYRGYAENPGAPSEAALVEDAHAAWRWLAADLGVRPERVVLCGESLGGGVATRLASDLCRAGTPPAGLVLRSTFSSLTDAAKHHFPWLPVRLLLIDTFRSDRAIPYVACPILHLHGTRDTIVPIALGRALFAAAPPASASGVEKRFVELRLADHNDVLATSGSSVREEWRRFLDTIARPAASP